MALKFPNTAIQTNANTEMEFDGFLRTDTAIVPAFKIMNDINANITTANGRPIVWGFTDFDIGNNATTTTFTAPLDGLYWMNVWMMDDNDGNNTNDYWNVRINGVVGGSANNSWYGYSSGRTAHHYQWDAGGIVELAEGDTVDIYVVRVDTGFYGTSVLYEQWSCCYVGRS